MDDSGNIEKLDALRAALNTDWERLNTAQEDWADRLGNVRGLLRSLAGAIEKHKAEDVEFREKTREVLDQLAAVVSSGGGASAELEARIATLEAELADSRTRAEDQSQQIASLEATLADRDAALTAASKASDDAQSIQQEVAELREAERALKTELASLRPVAEEASTAKSEMESQLALLQEQLAELEPQLNALREERDAANERLAELESGVSASGEQLAEAGRRAIEAEENAAVRERELAEALEQVTQAERELASARETHEQALATQEELGEQLTQLQKQLDAERDKARGFEEQVEDEKSRGTKATLAAQLAEALQEAEQARTEVRELRRALEQSQNQQASVVAAVPSVASPSPGRSSEEEVDLVRKAAEAKGGGKFTIGELLVNAGLVTQEQVDEAIVEQKQHRHQHIGAILVRNGWASEDAVAQALAYQCNVDFVRLSDYALNPDSAALISERLATQHSCIPVTSDDFSMTLAMVNPLDLVAIEDIERLTSRKVEVVVGAPREIQEAINKFFWEPD